MRSNQQSGPDWSSDNSDGSGIGSPFLGGPDKRPWFGPKRFGWGYGPTFAQKSWSNATVPVTPTW